MRTHHVLVEVWKEVLSVNDVAVDDNFFELGGHSLLAVQILFRVSDAFGVDISLDQLLANPTVRQLSAVIDALEEDKPMHVPRNSA